MGGINTVFLISSSLTMALGVRAAQTNKRNLATAMLAMTLAFAAGFLVIKYFEYSAKFEHGFLPGSNFHPVHPFHHPEANIFFGVYFMMTGVHGLHVIIGMGLITWILVRNLKGQFSSRYYSPVENVGLYWHLVDLIWIYLFPLLYLVG
jgi:cytochrome c oxidase subunit 3